MSQPKSRPTLSCARHFQDSFFVVTLFLHTSQEQTCRETVSQAKTSSGQRCKTVSRLKPSSLASVTEKYWKIDVGLIKGSKVPSPDILASHPLG